MHQAGANYTYTHTRKRLVVKSFHCGWFQYGHFGAGSSWDHYTSALAFGYHRCE